MYIFNPNRMQNYIGYSNMNTTSYLRVLHASPDAPAVDVYVNNNPVIKNLKYKEFSQYLPVMPGRYNVKVFPAGQMMNPVINSNILVPPMSAFTVAATGTLSDIGLMPIVDPYTSPVNANVAYARFAHLSPNAPAVDITLTDGTKLFSNVKYLEYADYIEVEPGMYTLQVRPAGSEDVVLTVPDVPLMPGKYQTIYAVGLVGDTPPLEAIASLDGGK